MSTDDFLPKTDVNEFEFDFLEGIPPEPKKITECSFAHDVRRLKRDLKEAKTQLKKSREENNRLHAKCSKQRELIDKYRKSGTIPAPAPVSATMNSSGRAMYPTHGVMPPVMSQPQVVYPGYSTGAPVIINDLNRGFNGVRY